MFRTSLQRALVAAAGRWPERGVGIFDSRGRRLQRRTLPEVVAAARDTAARLEELGVREGDRVVVALSTSWDWFDAWLGAHLKGALPLAVAPGTTAGSRAGLAGRLAGAVARVEPRRVICDDSLATTLRQASGESLAALALSPEELASSPRARRFRPADPDPAAVAFLQLTRGSTGLPRAVRIPHRAVAHQASAVEAAIAAPWDRDGGERIESMVSWLPLHHDMGLVGFFYAVLNGIDLWLLPPRAFLGRPRLWLEQLAGRGRTLTTAPNFGYQFTVERLRDRDLEDLDLSGFRAALTGAEMVRAETLDAFSDRLAPAGFDARCYRPCYGLAESTLAVTLDRTADEPRRLTPPAGTDAGQALSRVVSTGPPIPGTEVRIVAPDGSRAADGTIGRIRVRGPSVMDGYWNDPEATAEALVDGWLVTGDLGFVDGGELFVTGRSKDVLIVRGQNLMPHEVEWVAESATGGGGSCRAAAFTVARGGGGEEVVVVLETTQSSPAALAGLAGEARSRIGRELGLPLADLVLVRRGRLPKTTSGKVRRAELRRRYLAGRLERLQPA